MDFCVEMVPIGCPEMWVTEYRFTLSKISQEGGSQKDFFSCETYQLCSTVNRIYIYIYIIVQSNTTFC